MTARRQWLLTVLAVVATLFALSKMVDAGTIYDIEGVFAPSLLNKVPTNFVGKMEFPGDTVEIGVLKLELTDAPSLIREVPFSMTANTPGNPLQPWDSRLYQGLYEEKPVVMFSLDFDQLAGGNLLSDALDNGGGWDVWSVSFLDYTAGSISEMVKVVPVNEPAALALAAIGFVLVVGMAREYNRHT